MLTRQLAINLQTQNADEELPQKQTLVTLGYCPGRLASIIQGGWAVGAMLVFTIFSIVTKVQKGRDKQSPKSQ